MQVLVYPPGLQGVGEFDGGRIREQKPIAFPGEGSVVKRVGPLFYWAWATASAEAVIGLHPHKGFEIMTYVVEGLAYHGDTLGTDSVVGVGGAQVMQTGSGVSHQEKLSEGAELFQIWFEPEQTEAVKREPTYRQFEHERFPIMCHQDGYTVKTVIGPGAPIQVVADVRVWDVEVAPGAGYLHQVPEDYTLTGLAIRGHGVWAGTTAGGGSVRPESFAHKDFIVAAAREDTEADIRNTGEAELRLILIQVPTTVDYPLWPKR